MPDEGALREPAASQDWITSSRDWVRERSATQRWMALGVSIVLIAILAAAAHWFLEGQFHQTTDNAYVRADISVVAAKVGGYVRTMPAQDNQAVRRGEVLLTLDASDYEAAVAQARANLARARSELVAMGAQRSLAAADVERYRPLARRGIISQAGMQQIQARSAQMGGSQSASQAAVQAAQAALDAAELNLARTRIMAPIDGVIGDRQVQIGQLVQPGAPLMAVVPLQSLYVVANFKETQLGAIHAGQRVTVRPDVDHGMVLHGIVESIAPASGAEFSIIPMDTATGNFTKIVQRVPIRIRLDPAEVARARLRPGLSVTVDIDTRPPRQ